MLVILSGRHLLRTGGTEVRGVPRVASTYYAVSTTQRCTCRSRSAPNNLTTTKVEQLELAQRSAAQTQPPSASPAASLSNQATSNNSSSGVLHQAVPKNKASTSLAQHRVHETTSSSPSLVARLAHLHSLAHRQQRCHNTCLWLIGVHTVAASTRPTATATTTVPETDRTCLAACLLAHLFASAHLVVNCLASDGFLHRCERR